MKSISVSVEDIDLYISFILADAYKSAGLIIGAPTYEYGMFPPMKYLLEIMKKKHFWYKKVLYFGSFGWSGGAQKEFDALKENMHWDMFDPVVFKGHPTDEHLKKGELQASELARQVNTIPSKMKDEDY